MPLYIYKHPKKEEYKEVIQSVNDKHEYIENGLKWERVFTLPQINTQEKLNEHSNAKDFSRVTANQKGSVGDLWDRSKELSEKRKKIYGEDRVKKKYFEDWSKKRNGKVHPKNKTQ